MNHHQHSPFIISLSSDQTCSNSNEQNGKDSSNQFMFIATVACDIWHMLYKTLSVVHAPKQLEINGRVLCSN